MNDTSSPPPPADPALAALRAEIDALDDGMHDLLMRRAAVVARMAAGRAKAGGGSPLRPGREAAVLRRLLARHEGALARGAVARIWRNIFMAHTAIQGSFSVAVHAPAGQAGPVGLAREHFGTGTPLRSYGTPSQALAAVSSGEASVAVLPLPAEDADGAWWMTLDAPRLMVVARLPFLSAAQHAAGALVVAPVPPDASGDDRSLLMLEAGPDASRQSLEQGLADAGLPGRIPLLLRRNGRSLALVEVDGFLTVADSRLARLAFDRCLLLGAYAVPVAGDVP